MIQREIAAGTDISRACHDAVALADHHGEPVSFDFNGVTVVVVPGEAPAAAVARWNEEYSPEGRASAAAAEGVRRRHQRRTDDLMAALPRIVGRVDVGAVVRWCVSLSKAADHVGVAWNPHDVADVLESAGYVRDAHVGASPGQIGSSRRMTGEYLIGQALDCLRRGMPPHPVIDKFAREGGFLGTAGPDGGGGCHAE